MSRRGGDSLRSGLALAESSIDLVRSAPWPVLGAYYIGALPYAAGLLLFWNYMSHAADARLFLAPSAFALACLFLWLKVWQARYCQELAAHLRGLRPERKGFAGFCRTLGRQALLQSLGLVLMPLSFVFVLPFPWCHALFQSLTAREDGGDRPLAAYVRDGVEAAANRPRENAVMMWLFSPALLFAGAFLLLALLPYVATVMPLLVDTVLYFYLFLIMLLLLPLSPFPVGVFVNVGMGVLFSAMLLRSLFGIETVLTSVPGLSGSTLVWITVLLLTWLVLDPVLKAAYVLRCFEARTRTTGEDLLLALRQLTVRGTAVFALAAGALLLAAPPAAADTAIDSATLDAAIQAELEASRYHWRLPPDAPDDPEPGSLRAFVVATLEAVRDGIDAIGQRIGRFIDWLLPDSSKEGAAAGIGFVRMLQDSLRGLLVLLAVVLAVAALYLVYRNRKALMPRPPDETPGDAMPDLEDEGTGADALPTDGWSGLARELLAAGEFRLAARAAFLAVLAALAEENRVVLARHKTNRDYRRELERFRHVLPELPDIFARMSRIYEGVWYGDRPAGADLVNDLLEQQQRIQRHAG